MHKNSYESYKAIRKEWKINPCQKVKGSKKAYSRKNFKINIED